MDNFKRVCLRRELYDLIKKRIAGRGYGSVSEFVNDAVRRRLEELDLLKEADSCEIPKVIVDVEPLLKEGS